MKKSKRLLMYGLGVTSLVAAPISVVTSCGSKKKTIDTSTFSFPGFTNFNNSLRGFNGQASYEGVFPTPPTGTFMEYSYKGENWTRLNTIDDLPSTFSNGDNLRLKLVPANPKVPVTDSKEINYKIAGLKILINTAGIPNLEENTKFTGINGSGSISPESFETIPGGVDAWGLYDEAPAYQDISRPPAANDPKWIHFNGKANITNLSNTQIIWLQVAPLPGYVFSHNVPIKGVVVKDLANASKNVSLAGLTFPDLITRSGDKNVPNSKYLTYNEKDVTSGGTIHKEGQLSWTTEQFNTYVNDVLDSIPPASKTSVKVEFSVVMRDESGQPSPAGQYSASQPNLMLDQYGSDGLAPIIYVKIFPATPGDKLLLDSGATGEISYDFNDQGIFPQAPTS